VLFDLHPLVLDHARVVILLDDGVHAVDLLVVLLLEHDLLELLL